MAKSLVSSKEPMKLAPMKLASRWATAPRAEPKEATARSLEAERTAAGERVAAAVACEALPTARVSAEAREEESSCAPPSSQPAWCARRPR